MIFFLLSKLGKWVSTKLGIIQWVTFVLCHKTVATVRCLPPPPPPPLLGRAQCRMIQHDTTDKGARVLETSPYTSTAGTSEYRTRIQSPLWQLLMTKPFFFLELFFASSAVWLPGAKARFPTNRPIRVTKMLSFHRKYFRTSVLCPCAKRSSFFREDVTYTGAWTVK